MLKSIEKALEEQLEAKGIGVMEVLQVYIPNCSYAIIDINDYKGNFHSYRVYWDGEIRETNEDFAGYVKSCQ